MKKVEKNKKKTPQTKIRDSREEENTEQKNKG
jgi:hypothetical protein